MGRLGDRLPGADHRPVAGPALSGPDHIYGLPGLRWLEEHKETDKKGRTFLHVIAETIEPVADHPCDPEHWYVKERRSKTLDHVALGQLPIKVEIKRRFYKCLACEAANRRPMYFKESTAAYEAYRSRKTEDLFQEIAGRSGKRNYTEMAEDNAISDQGVRSVVRRMIRRHGDTLTRAPLVLGLDEKKLKGEWRGIICDIGQKKVLGIAEDDGELLYQVLEAMHDRERTMLLVTDMATKFNRIHDDLFRGIPRVIDKWHVVKRGMVALKKYRKHLLDTNPRAEKSVRQMLWGATKLLTKRYHDLDYDQLEALLTLFDHWPELEAAYEHKEDLFRVYDATTPQEAEFAYHLWEECTPEHCRWWFKKWAFLQPEWKPHVFAYFDWRHTNAFVESMNRKLDDIHREGRRLSLEAITWKLMQQMNRHEVSSRALDRPDYEIETPDNRVRVYRIGKREKIKVVGRGKVLVKADMSIRVARIRHPELFEPPTYRFPFLEIPHHGAVRPTG